MKDTHKIYEAPTLKAMRLSSGQMILTTSVIPSGKEGAPGEAESKAFWGPSLFDDEDDEDYIDAPL